MTSIISIIFSIRSISNRYEKFAEQEVVDLSRNVENLFHEYLGDLTRKALFLSELKEVSGNMKNIDDILTMIELKAFFLASTNIRILNNKKEVVITKNFAQKSNLAKENFLRMPFFKSRKDPILRKSGILKIGNNISLLSVSPIIDKDTFQISGLLILEMPVDSEVADQIRENVKSEIIFYCMQKKLGTTFLDQNGERFFPEYALASNREENHELSVSRVILDEKTYLVNRILISDSIGKNIGFADVFFRIDDLITSKRLDIRSLIWVSALIFLITIALSFFLGRKLSAPIVNLSEGAEAVSKGDLDFHIKPVTKDEIGILTEMFNKMTISLKTHRENLEHMRLYLKNIIDSMPSILIGVDVNGFVTQWNAEAERKTSVESADAIGKSLPDLFPQFEKDLELFKESIKQKSPQKVEKVLAKIKDNVQYTDIMIYPLVANGVEGAVIRMDDVTSRVRIENMMMQTEKMMSVGGLAAGMAHEINNPLGGILLGSQNIIRRFSDSFQSNVKTAEECGINFDNLKLFLEKQKILEFIKIIQKSGERASDIVTNMLNFSRRSEQKKEEVDLSEVVASTIELARNDYDLKKKYDFRHIIIKFSDKPQIPPVKCIKNEIQQVILNLLKNAVQALIIHGKKNIEPCINIDLKKENRMAVLKISDNGPGMDEETRKRVFEPFFTTKEVGEGTGLGLSVSYFIITSNHKGIIYVDSEKDKGTTFIIKLPYYIE